MISKLFVVALLSATTIATITVTTTPQSSTTTNQKVGCNENLIPSSVPTTTGSRLDKAANRIEYIYNQEVNVTTTRLVRDEKTNATRTVQESVIISGPSEGNTENSSYSNELDLAGDDRGSNRRPTRSSEKEQTSSTTADKKVLTNQFVIQVQGGELEARKLAEKHGFKYLNHILDDYYHLEHVRLAKRSLAEHDHFSSDSIRDEPQVLKIERQVLKRRVKRDFLELPRPDADIEPRNKPTDRLESHQQQNLHLTKRNPTTNDLSTFVSLLNGQPRIWQQPPSHHQITRPPNQTPNSSSVWPQSQTAEQRQQELEAIYLKASRMGLVHSSDPLEASTSASQTITTSGSPTLAGYQQQQLIGSRNKYNNNSSSRSNNPTLFNDPEWPLMWYLDGGAKNGFDLNVKAAWEMGYTGKGIVITILDDGLEKDHPDLAANYDPLASSDINSGDADPMPHYDINLSNRHGTRCAGEVAAIRDNNICSVGIAYNSKVGGVRMLDGEITDAVEARSLSLNNQHIHIYSASWGPDDNGITVDGPGELATRAFIDGVTNGRQGLGSIFVFASGNGGTEHDNCNCDGYTNSIWTLSISSTTENGAVPWYIEACSSTLATTYSSGSTEERQITTTDLHHKCTSNHTGTSASAPLAAGICALVLESNPRLNWRDMQHIVVRTAKPANLQAKDWRPNGMGRNVSNSFGYGLMDAAAMVTMAKQWTTVPDQFTCQISSPPIDKPVAAKGVLSIKLEANCLKIRHLEHVQARILLTATRRGDLDIYLISPSKTRSTLLAQRPKDNSESGFRNWPFMTVHNWGESPTGSWILEVHNNGSQNRVLFKNWTLILYGTSEDPNKHLDDNSIYATQAPTHQNLRPNLATSRQPSTSSPPAPIAHTESAEVQSTTTTSQRPDNRVQINTQWSIQPPIPGPISVGGDDLSSTTTQLPPTSTTTTPPPKIVASNINNEDQLPFKKDFGIVIPSTSSPPNSTDNFGDLQSPGRFWPHTGSGINQDSTLKPTINQIHDNKIDPLQNQSTGNGILRDNNSLPTNTFQDIGLDSNQLDLKQSKDHRSSGGQTFDASFQVKTNDIHMTVDESLSSRQQQQNSAHHTNADWLTFISAIIASIIVLNFRNSERNSIRPYHN